MSPIDPRELKNAKRTYKDVIATDRPCGKCRYNLKGLPTDGRCPECGHPISGKGRGFRRFSDNLADAPLFYLRTLATGSWILALSTLAMLVCSMMAHRTYDVRWAVALGVGAVAWWTGVYIVTAPRVFGESTLRDEVLDGPAFRIINRIVHVAWPLLSVAYVVVAKAPASVERYAELAAAILQIVGVLGLIPLAIQLASLCDWAGDTTTSERLRVVAWVMGAAGLCVIAGKLLERQPVLVSGLLRWAGGIGLGVLSIAQIVFVISLIQLASMTAWAIENNRTAAATTRRAMTSRQRHEQEMAERTAVAIALQDASPPPEIASEAPTQTPFESNKVERPDGGANPYEIDPNQPS